MFDLDAHFSLCAITFFSSFDSSNFFFGTHKTQCSTHLLLHTFTHTNDATLEIQNLLSCHSSSSVVISCTSLFFCFFLEFAVFFLFFLGDVCRLRFLSFLCFHLFRFPLTFWFHSPPSLPPHSSLPVHRKQQRNAAHTKKRNDTEMSEFRPRCRRVRVVRMSGAHIVML